MPSWKGLAGGLAVAMVFAVGGSAQAADTGVVAVIRAQDKVLNDSRQARDARALLHLEDVRTDAQARRLLRELSDARARLDHAAALVSRASTATTRQRRGQRDWVSAVRQLSRGLGQDETGIRDLAAGRRAAGKAEYRTAFRTFEAAGALDHRADRLLGLRNGD